MTRRMLIVVVLGGLASSLIGVVPAGAQACTISGTDGADNVVGTSNGTSSALAEATTGWSGAQEQTNSTG